MLCYQFNIAACALYFLCDLKLYEKGLERITKMQNLSQYDLDQITKMLNLLQNEPEQIAKMRCTKTCKNMSNEGLLISLLKSEQRFGEL